MNASSVSQTCFYCQVILSATDAAGDSAKVHSVDAVRGACRRGLRDVHGITRLRARDLARICYSLDPNKKWFDGVVHAEAVTECVPRGRRRICRTAIQACLLILEKRPLCTCAEFSYSWLPACCRLDLRSSHRPRPAAR